MPSHEMLRKLLEEFVEKETLVSEELSLIVEQIGELESRLETCRARLGTIGQDRAIVMQIKARYTDGNLPEVPIAAPHMVAPIHSGPTKLPNASVTNQPTTSAANQPTASAANQPTASAANQPMATAANQPTSPAANQAVASVSNQPTAPGATQPTAPHATQRTVQSNPAAAPTKSPWSAWDDSDTSAPSVPQTAQPFAAPPSAADAALAQDFPASAPASANQADYEPEAFDKIGEYPQESLHPANQQPSAQPNKQTGIGSLLGKRRPEPAVPAAEPAVPNNPWAQVGAWGDPEPEVSQPAISQAQSASAPSRSEPHSEPFLEQSVTDDNESAWSPAEMGASNNQPADQHPVSSPQLTYEQQLQLEHEQQERQAQLEHQQWQQQAQHQQAQVEQQQQHIQVQQPEQTPQPQWDQQPTWEQLQQQAAAPTASPQIQWEQQPAPQPQWEQQQTWEQLQQQSAAAQPAPPTPAPAQPQGQPAAQTHYQQQNYWMPEESQQSTNGDHDPAQNEEESDTVKSINDALRSLFR